MSPTDNTPNTNDHDHPADLVIDAFGTFLGKRSQRLLVRWRASSQESENGTRGSRKTNSDSGTRGSNAIDQVPQVLQFPGHGRSQEESTPHDDTPSTAESHQPDEADPAEATARKLLSLWQSKTDKESASTSHNRDHQSRTRSEDQSKRLERLAQVDGTNTSTPPTPPWQERQVPFSRLRSVVVAGRGITLSSDLVEALVERGIQLSFLSSRGNPVAQLSAPALGATVQTRRDQLAAYSTPRGVQLAVSFVDGKLRNQRHGLLYFAKYLKTSDPDRHERMLKKLGILARLRQQLKNFSGADLEAVRDRLMGLEGTGGRVYWEAVAVLLEGKVDFPGRATRGALDPVNASLNYGYGILYSQAFGAVTNAGLEPFAGFLHVDRPGKPSLVLDLVEEFRAPVVDRAVLALFNQRVQVEVDEHGLTAPTRRLLADRVRTRLETPVPFEGKRYPLRMVIQMQARHLATAVRGERTYKPFASRW